MEASGRRLFPADGGSGPIHGTPRLSNPPHDERPYVAINMVASIDGRAALHGSAVGLGSEVDLRLLRELRAEADAILHGAQTVRVERMTPSVPPDLSEHRLARGLPAQPLGVVLSNSGSVPADRPYFRDTGRRLMYVPAHAEVSAPPNVEVVHLGSGTLQLGEVLRDLRGRGVERVVCEGGPTINAALLTAGLVDDVFLTLAPRLVGGRDPLTMVVGELLGPRRAALRSIYERDGELFLRYGVE